MAADSFKTGFIAVIMAKQQGFSVRRKNTSSLKSRTVLHYTPFTSP
jgi:hypothetical protein